ncbi:hypothetical protein TNCT_349621 [Trichonephila clavata]|uniref:Uncharacterized protein n=1 Tax=Trichonephila clavata TaxID=2740835 RepID=A0A8X6M5J9_TRICU|nr:hypothetical protein TNCT_349621 [Trichonephila clavata]
MRTEHDYHAAHLHRINVLPSPECQLCGYGTMNAERLRTRSALDHSKNYQNSYWSAHHLWPNSQGWALAEKKTFICYGLPLV